MLLSTVLDNGIHLSASTETAKGVFIPFATLKAVRAEQVASAEPPEVLKVVTDPKDGLAFGEGFHTDLTYRKTPPSVGCFIVREPSPHGTGDTKFLSMVEAWGTLPPELQRRVQHMWAVHSDLAGREAIHPVARKLDGGKTALFVNGHFTRSIVGGDVVDDLHNRSSDSDGGLLTELLSHINEMEPMRMSWEQSDLVLWDEAATQHAAVHDYYGHRRELHRVLVSGSSPPK